MADWWKGKVLDQATHRQINAAHYPGTRQLCVLCDAPTGRCEEDTIELPDGTAPVCESCLDEHDYDPTRDAHDSYYDAIAEKRRQGLLDGTYEPADDRERRMAEEGRCIQEDHK